MMKRKQMMGALTVVLGLAGLPGLRVKGAESLDRGVVALRNNDAESVYVGWRLLASDPDGRGFDLFRSDRDGRLLAKVNPQPITESCNYVDERGNASSAYYVVQPVGGKASRPARVISGDQGPAYRSLRLMGDDTAQKVGIADLDGDGAYDYVVKHPNFNTDPYQQPGYWKRSTDTYKLEAYRSDGTFLWRYDMGWAIEEGIWYSPIVVYDLDGDGKAEVFTKAGEGDPRDADGKVTQGSEFLVVLDGLTGKVRHRLPWPTREGFQSYNYYSRNLMGIAYLDGRRPHLIIERGTYKLIKLSALDPALNPKWHWEAKGEHAAYRGQGMHGMHAVDVDNDGRDEVIIGSAAIDDEGQPLWTTRLGHPDGCYVADIDPERPGLEIFYGIEPSRASHAVCLVEARTGKVLWGNSERTKHVHGQAMIGDIDPLTPGIECYAGEKDGSRYWLYSAGGELLSDQSLGELAPKAVYWTDQPTKVYVSRGRIYEYPRREMGRLEGRVVAVADCLGDWREEVLCSLPGEVRIYTTTIPARARRVCLMQDRLYRTDVAVQTMGYFHPPQLSGQPVPR